MRISSIVWQQQVNEFRRDHGLKSLTLDPMISAEAREHSADMARAGKAISHRGFNQRLQDIQKNSLPSCGRECGGCRDPARALIRISRNHRLCRTDGNFCWKFRERYNGRPSVIAALPEKRSASPSEAAQDTRSLKLSTK